MIKFVWEPLGLSDIKKYIKKKCTTYICTFRIILQKQGRPSNGAVIVLHYLFKVHILWFYLIIGPNHVKLNTAILQ